MPFDIQMKGFIAGMLFAYFVLPMILGAVGGMGSKKTPAQTTY